MFVSCPLRIQKMQKQSTILNKLKELKEAAWNIPVKNSRSHQFAKKYAVKTGDLKNWEDISDRIHFPKGTRHGTIFRASKPILTKLLQSD